MRKNKHLVSLILLVGVIFSYWRACPAQDAGDASSALCEYGIKLYKEGQVEDAIHELKKALMINPHNLKARNYLTKIYSERGLPFGPLAAPAKKIKINEYEDQIKKLQEEARYYQKQLRDLNDQNLAKDAELDQLNRQLQSQKELFGRKEQDLLLAHKGRRDKITELESQIGRLQKEIGDYQKEFTTLNDQYLAKTAELERLNRQLQAYKGRGEKIAELENQLNRLQKETSDYQKQLAALNGQYQAKETELERLMQSLNSQKELLGKKEQELLYTQREQKKHLAELADKRKELAKLKADYENRLKKMEAKLKAKQAEENLLINECQTAWMQDQRLWDDFKEAPLKLECEFDEEFLSAETLDFAEKQGLSSWEKLNSQLQVLMPAFYEEESLYADDKDFEFEEIKPEETKDIDPEAMLSDLDN